MSVSKLSRRGGHRTWLAMGRDAKPVAYGNGTSGGVFHPDCWFEMANDYFIANRARAFLGTLYYSGRELKGQTCPRCGKGWA